MYFLFSMIMSSGTLRAQFQGMIRICYRIPLVIHINYFYSIIFSSLNCLAMLHVNICLVNVLQNSKGYTTINGKLDTQVYRDDITYRHPS